MKHRSNRTDGDAWTSVIEPRHRRSNSMEELLAAQEDDAYRAWCRKHGLNPDNTSSAVAYEGEIGYLYIPEPPEDHR